MILKKHKVPWAIELEKKMLKNNQNFSAFKKNASLPILEKNGVNSRELLNSFEFIGSIAEKRYFLRPVALCPGGG